MAIAAGDVITVSLYFILKTNSHSQIQPTIHVIHSFKDATTPEISTDMNNKFYSIYKIRICSQIRKYSIVVENEKCRLESGEIKFNDKPSSKLLFDQCVFLDMNKPNRSNIGMLEKIIVFSIHP
jgi:hypothetical protein